MITAMRVSVCIIIYFCNAFCALLETPCHVHFVHCNTGIVEWCIKPEDSPFLLLLMRVLFPEAELEWGLRCEWQLEQLNFVMFSGNAGFYSSIKTIELCEDARWAQVALFRWYLMDAVWRLFWIFFWICCGEWKVLHQNSPNSTRGLIVWSQMVKW